jgi:hypothetical protein
MYYGDFIYIYIYITIHLPQVYNFVPVSNATLQRTPTTVVNFVNVDQKLEKLLRRIPHKRSHVPGELIKSRRLSQ